MTQESALAEKKKKGGRKSRKMPGELKAEAKRGKENFSAEQGDQVKTPERGEGNQLQHKTN